MHHMILNKKTDTRRYHIHYMHYKYTEDERVYYILNAALLELMDMPTSKRWVLQNRILLFSLLNGFVTKRQFLILCNRYDIYGGLGTHNEATVSHAYFRRFFSRACANKLFLKVSQRYSNGKSETVYVISATGRDRLKEGICMCELTLMDSMWCTKEELLSSIDLCFCQKKRFRETMHPEHTFGISDFHAACTFFSLCRFLPEIDIENSNSRNGYPGEHHAVICDNLPFSFRADAYVKISLDRGFLLHNYLFLNNKPNSLPGSVLGKGTTENMYEPFTDTHFISILLEQDTGTQRKDILKQKLQNYSFLYTAAGNADENGIFCLVYSFLNTAYGRTRMTQQMYEDGKLEVDFFQTLFGEIPDDMISSANEEINACHKESDSSMQEECFYHSQDSPTLDTLCRQMELGRDTLIELYDALLGVCCILHNDDIGFLSPLMQRSLLLPHPGQEKIQAWKKLLSVLTECSITSLLSCYQVFHTNEATIGTHSSGADAAAGGCIGATVAKDESKGACMSMSAKQYGTYHRDMVNFLARRRILEECFLDEFTVQSAVLAGHMLVTLPAQNLHALLPLLFVNKASFKKLSEYMNCMYAGITDVVSYSAVGKTHHGRLLNQYTAKVINGIRTYYFENLSLDLGARPRLLQYLRDYAAEPEQYEGETIVVFFLSDDLDRARTLSQELSLYRSYESGQLKERAINRTSPMTEILFVCIEDIDRGMPAIYFDRLGNAHYKAMLHHGLPHLYDVPASARNCSVPEEKPF